MSTEKVNTKKVNEPCQVDELLPAFTLGIHTGLRNEELRFLRWRQVDLLNGAITVGKAKTPSGDGRVIPLNQTAARVLSTWSQQFPERTPEHYDQWTNGVVHTHGPIV